MPAFDDGKSVSTSATVEPEHQSGEHRLQGRKAESIEISTDPVLNCNHAKLESEGGVICSVRSDGRQEGRVNGRKARFWIGEVR